MTARKNPAEFAVNSLKTAGSAEISADGSVIIESPETFETSANWDALLAHFGVDPQAVIVKGATIRVSARTVTLTDDDGYTITKVARSFSAAFQPRPEHWISDEEMDALGRDLRSRGVKHGRRVKGNSTFLVCLADLQLGKSEGGGVKATLARYNEALDGVVEQFLRLKEQGYKFEQVAVAQMGDLLEGCSGNYDSQTFTVELNQRRQMKIALEVMTATIDRMLEVTHVPVHVISVNSNHGSWMRRGGKGNITSDSDTSDGAIHDALKTVFRRDARVTFTDLNDEAVIRARLSGVNVGFSHGHLTTPAKSDKWLDDQARVLERLYDFPPDVFVTAHSHHFMQRDLGAYQHFQCPALDGGSKWFQDARGRWSSAGILTMVLGDWMPVSVAEVACQWAVRG